MTRLLAPYAVAATEVSSEPALHTDRGAVTSFRSPIRSAATQSGRASSGRSGATALSTVRHQLASHSRSGPTPARP